MGRVKIHLIKSSFLVLAGLSLALSVSANDCTVFNVSGSVGWSSLLIEEKNNAISGMAIDIMTEVSDRLSIPFEFNQLPWKRSLVYLSEGKLDIILGIYWTKERAEKFYYTTPILKNEARVFVLKKNQFKFKELSDLIGRRGDIPLGGSFGEDFDQYAKAHLTLSALGNKEEHIGRLQLKRSDFFISDYADAIAVIHQKGLQDKIVALAKPVSTTYVYFAVSKASPCAHLVPEIVNTLEWLRHDNTLDKLSTKYLTQFK